MLLRVGYRGAEAHAEVTPSGVLVVEFRGLILAESHAAMKLRIAAQFGCRTPRAVVADYSGSALALTSDQVDAMMAGKGPENLPDLPAAVVVGAGWHSRMMCAVIEAGFSHGFRRVVMPSAASALAWAEGATRQRS